MKLKHPKLNEHQLQSQCVAWFRRQYPKYSRNIFAVPNARKCDYRQASYLKKEGVLAGVSDCILLVARDKMHALCIEFKVGNNKQTAEQIAYELAVRRENYAYYVVRSFDDFVSKINSYLEDKPEVRSGFVRVKDADFNTKINSYLESDVLMKFVDNYIADKKAGAVAPSGYNKLPYSVFNDKIKLKEIDTWITEPDYTDEER